MGTGSPVDIEIEPQSAGDTMLVTVTLYNHYRYMREVPVVQPGITEESKPLPESRVWLNQTIFRANLAVNYILPDKEWIRISLYDATGRMVGEYEGGLVGKGVIRLDTDHFASGVYFVRIERGNQVETQQVILLK
jgi:hypothetical protein